MSIGDARCGAPTWVEGASQDLDWRAVDRALRGISRRRGELDVEEAHWLREAEALQIWQPLGMVSVLDYLERVLGYTPRTAQERLRVARALGALPRLTAALAGGVFGFSAVRELTRVTTPATEAAWIDAATGKTVHQIEELVSGHRPGDAPDDPPDPDVRTRVVRFELSPESFALLRQARVVLDDEHGTNLPDDAFVAALCSAVLDGAGTTEPTGRAKFQVAVTLCRRCRQGWQEGAGAQIAIGDAAVERALCDAQHIGSIDGDAPERAYQDVAPNVRRFVWRRDGGRCRVPGCRSARGLELHHLVHRSDGGSHDAANLAVLCFSCHERHHAGTLTITGPADRLEVRRPGQAVSCADGCAHAGTRVGSEPEADPGAHAGTRAGSEPEADPGAHVGARVGSRLDLEARRAQVKDALCALGWRAAVARSAVEAAFGALGREAPLERLIFDALRRCPRPVTAGAGDPEVR